MGFPGSSTKRSKRPQSYISNQGSHYPSQANRTLPGTGNSVYAAPHTSRRSSVPPDIVDITRASVIRAFDQQWTLEDAPTCELHKLAVNVSLLARDHSMDPVKRKKNEETYLSLYQRRGEEVDRAVLLTLIPSLKTELADGLIDDLLGGTSWFSTHTSTDHDQLNRSTIQIMCQKSSQKFPRSPSLGPRDLHFSKSLLRFLGSRDFHSYIAISFGMHVFTPHLLSVHDYLILPGIFGPPIAPRSTSLQSAMRK
jgi:hypothetical protein